MQGSDQPKSYRKTYNQYITNISGKLHNLHLINNEYEKSYRLWRSCLEKYLKSYNKKKSLVLDIGCGLGHNLYFFQKLGYDHVYGIDLSLENISFVKQQGFKTEKADAFDFLKAYKGKYDIISMFDIIEHLTKDEIMKLLYLIKRSLRKDGLLIIETLNANHPFFGRILFGDITHETAYNTSSMGELLYTSGFQKNHIFTINSFYTWHPQLIQRIVRRYLLQGIAGITEYIYKLLALSQGVFLKECKPILVALVYK